MGECNCLVNSRNKGEREKERVRGGGIEEKRRGAGDLLRGGQLVRSSHQQLPYNATMYCISLSKGEGG